MRFTRRQVLVGAATSGLGAAGLYELVDRLASSSPAHRTAGRLHPEQHVLDGLAVVRDNGVTVVAPPLHHTDVTARVATDDLTTAQHEFEHAVFYISMQAVQDRCVSAGVDFCMNVFQPQAGKNNTVGPSQNVHKKKELVLDDIVLG